jgi:hypothetical protein
MMTELEPQLMSSFLYGPAGSGPEIFCDQSYTVSVAILKKIYQTNKRATTEPGMYGTEALSHTII